MTPENYNDIATACTNVRRAMFQLSDVFESTKIDNEEDTNDVTIQEDTLLARTELENTFNYVEEISDLAEAATRLSKLINPLAATTVNDCLKKISAFKSLVMHEEESLGEQVNRVSQDSQQ
jgi:hypothetical protein